MSTVAEAVADIVIADGYLLHPERLLDSLRNPPGRAPSETSLAVSRAVCGLKDVDAIVLIRAVLDAATFSFFNLLDQDFKNSGIHARFALGDDGLETAEANGRFHEAYRDRIDPNGIPTGFAGTSVQEQRA